MKLFNLKAEKYNQGVILITVLIISLVLAVIATTILGMGLYSYQQATFYYDYNQALYTAEAGINWCVSRNTASGTFVNFASPSTGPLNYAGFYVQSSTMAGDTIQIISTATVMRLTPRVRALSMLMIDQSPFKHFIWQGCSGAPSGSDPTEYPDGYNSTNNGPIYGTGEIGRVNWGIANWPYGGKKFQPYFSKITAKRVPNAIYMGRDTTFINWTPTAGGPTYQFSTIGNTLPSWFSSTVKGLHVEVNGPGDYNVYGKYTGLLYLQGTVHVGDPLYIYGQFYVVAGNIDINKTNLTVMQVTAQNPASGIIREYDNDTTSYQQYVTIACLDTTAPYTCPTTSTNPNAGNVTQQTGNSTLQMGDIGTPFYYGGLMFISNADFKNGQGTNINGVMMMMDNDINGFPSGEYFFDPTVDTDRPLGIDISYISGKRSLTGTWREIPTTWGL